MITFEKRYIVRSVDGKFEHKPLVSRKAAQESYKYAVEKFPHTTFEIVLETTRITREIVHTENVAAEPLFG